MGKHCTALHCTALHCTALGHILSTLWGINTTSPSCLFNAMPIICMYSYTTESSKYCCLQTLQLDLDFLKFPNTDQLDQVSSFQEPVGRWRLFKITVFEDGNF
jgi:hypothetical protein